jgi:hypothetical protein
MTIYDTREGARLALNRDRKGHWNRWGPYLSERAWGTVREDYSADGDAWSYFPHDHARSCAYRWSEDGIAGISDRHQQLCFALGLWNGRDPILKERMFGLTGTEGNHGEDVKEYYFYVDSTPTHSYMRMLYKYPQAEFPYQRLIDENRNRDKMQPEFELADTGVFDGGQYFEVVAEYAKADAEDLLIRISITNRGPQEATIDVMPTLWFRNTWSWGRDSRRPAITGDSAKSKQGSLVATHWQLGKYILHFTGADEVLFTENETNTRRFGMPSGATAYFKDAFHEYVVNGKRDAVNPANTGTKAGVRFHRTVQPGATVAIDLRLTAVSNGKLLQTPFATFDKVLNQRKDEADEFYETVLGESLTPDQKLVARQAFAGLLWSKQFFHYVVSEWLEGDPGQPAPPQRRQGRNHDWTHLHNQDVISMPDKWEFPWFASWDLGFHCIPLSYIDPSFAKEQILLMLREWYMHPNGQIPAYEWDFGDVNPPVLPLAARAVFEIERAQTGVADYEFLERVFQKMLLNFTWWVNRKDALGRNIFQGGFLGMDNIGAFDRGKLPPGYLLGQADGTSWMAAFAKSMLSNALLLAERNPTYQDLASKFWEHFIYIANSLVNHTDPSRSLWNEQDGFFYDNLISPKGEFMPIRARTMVGFSPIFAASAAPAALFERNAAFERRRQWFIKNRADLVHNVSTMVTPGVNNTLLLSFVRPDQLKRMLHYMLDENEFLSPYGIRAVSRFHKEHPLILNIEGQEHRLDYEPGESQTNLFGGNSNWRGPIWFPVNFLILFSLRQYHLYLGEDFKVECPTGSGKMMNLHQVAGEIATRLSRIFLLDAQKQRAVFGGKALFNQDPNWRDLIPFHEYFHGDSGRGCGASHQTGWTGLVSTLLMNIGNKPLGQP